MLAHCRTREDCQLLKQEGSWLSYRLWWTKNCSDMHEYLRNMIYYFWLDLSSLQKTVVLSRVVMLHLQLAVMQTWHQQGKGIMFTVHPVSQSNRGTRKLAHAPTSEFIWKHGGASLTVLLASEPDLLLSPVLREGSEEKSQTIGLSTLKVLISVQISFLYLLYGSSWKCPCIFFSVLVWFTHTHTLAFW